MLQKTTDSQRLEKAVLLKKTYEGLVFAVMVPTPGLPPTTCWPTSIWGVPLFLVHCLCLCSTHISLMDCQTQGPDDHNGCAPDSVLACNFSTLRKMMTEDSLLRAVPFGL